MAIIQNNAYAAVTACHPAAAVKCQQLAQDFSATYWGGHDSALQSGGAQTVSSLMFVVPVLLGVFVGRAADLPRAGHRHVPVRLDAGRGPDPLGPVDPGAARGCC